MVDNDKLEAFITEFKTVYKEVGERPENLRRDRFPTWQSGVYHTVELPWNTSMNIGGCVYCYGDVEWGWGPPWDFVYKGTKHVFEKFGFRDPFPGEGCWTEDRLREALKQQMEAQEKEKPQP